MRTRTIAIVLAAAGLLGACGDNTDGDSSGSSNHDSPLRIGVGPLLPTTEDTVAAWEPFFEHVADELGVDFTLTATTDWAGMAVAMDNDQLDLAWMGPFGYVLAENTDAAEALAVALYNGEPSYHAIVVAPNNIQIDDWPDDAKGMTMSFTDTGSTSGWLIPTYWLSQRGIDPKEFFDYSEGATHSANQVAAAEGTVDLATDFDRNRNAMIAEGIIAEDDNQIIWESDPLPNDALAVRPGLDEDLKQRIQEVLVSMSEEQAIELLPEGYTGFHEAHSDTYTPIRDAAVELGVVD
jgi:phosphonate transport system substrate-binding protein